MKRWRVGIMSLIGAGVIGLGSPATEAADCLDLLSGEKSYACNGTAVVRGDVGFDLDFSASVGESLQFTGRLNEWDLLCACGYKGDPEHPTFGTEKTIACVGKPRELLAGYVQTLSFAAHVATARRINKGTYFEIGTAPSGAFGGGVAAVECTLLP